MKLKFLMGRSLQEKCQHRKFLITAELMWLIPKYWMRTSSKSNWIKILLGIIYCFHIKVTACWYNRGKTCLWGRWESTGTKGAPGILQGLASPCCRDRRAALWGLSVPEQSSQTLPSTSPTGLPVLWGHLAAFPPSPLPGFPLFLPFLRWPLIPAPAPSPASPTDCWLQLKLRHSSIQVLLIPMAEEKGS